MPRLSSLLSFVSLAAYVSGIAIVGRDTAVPPNFAGPDGYNVSPTKRDTVVPPNFAGPNGSSSKREVSLEKRQPYSQVFAGTGTDPSDRDASIQGGGYLTFTRLDSYDLTACEDWCDGIAACAFINLFDEFNSDATYNPQHKCVAYAYPQDASLKTNWGGQQLLPPPAGVTYIQNSVGYTSVTFENPPTPPGYVFVFGPTNGANEAPGLDAGHSLSSYDVQGCADLCSAASDCLYFNIWLGVQNGNPTYTCALYSIPTDASTATNYGQGGLQVTNSRGYRRIVELIEDGGFEDFHCSDGGSFCYATSDGPWQGDSNYDSEIYLNPPYARTGQVSGLLGNGYGSDANPGTLRYVPALATIPGQTYLISFWQQSTWSITDQAAAFVQVLWNDATVFSVNTGYEAWTQYTVQVTAVGGDHLAFYGGSFPAYNFIDDISVTLV